MNYNWIISGVDYLPQEAGFTKVIKIIHWRMEATQGELKVDDFGAFYLAPPTSHEFIAFSQVDTPTIIEWLEKGFSKEDELEAPKTMIQVLKEKLAYRMAEKVSANTLRQSSVSMA